MFDNDNFTITDNVSLFGRLGGSIKGIFFGIIVAFIAFPLLFWNEGRSVKRVRALNEGAGAIISVPSDTVSSSNNEALVHLNGRADTDDILTDVMFGMSDNVLRMNRIVEMYQWEEIKETETRTKLGGGQETVTTYEYRKKWSDNIIKSNNFERVAGHENPNEMPFSNEKMVAQRVRVGAFTLPRSLVTKIKTFESLNPRESDGYPDSVRIRGDQFYYGDNPSSPNIGDTRVRFEAVRPTYVSIVAQQVGDGLSAYYTSNGGRIELLEVGSLAADSMFEIAQQENRVSTWILRAIGFLMMWFGFGIIVRPLRILADVVPFFGRIVGSGLGTITFLTALPLFFMVIAFSWIFYRPLIGIPLLAVALISGYFLQQRLRTALAPA